MSLRKRSNHAGFSWFLAFRDARDINLTFCAELPPKRAFRDIFSGTLSLSLNVPGTAMKRQSNRPSLKELLESGDLIAPAELARGLKVSLSTVYCWAERGQIPHLRLGKAVRFEPESIRTWLDERRKHHGHNKTAS